MSPTTRRITRAKNADTHPGDAIPKQVKRTKEQLEAAKEAEKAAKKKKEVADRKKLTNVAQAADNVVLEMKAQAKLEPRVRPKRPLKRAYAMLDVMATSEADNGNQSANSNIGSSGQPRAHLKRPLKRSFAMLNVTGPAPSEADKENQLATSDTGEQSDSYAPSEASVSESIDPASDSDGHAGEPPKKRGKAKKASVLSKIKAHRQHLDPIEEEEQDMEEQQEVLMANELQVPRANHAGLKKSWVAQRAGNVNDATINSEPKAVAAPKTSKRATTQKTNQKAKSSAKSSSLEEAIPQVSQVQTEVQAAQPRPRPRPRPRSQAQVSKVFQDQFPVTPLAPTTRQEAEPLHATPINVGGGIPSDVESDSEEREAAKSSPIKPAGKRITSNAIVAILPQAAAENGVRKSLPHAPFTKQRTEPAKQAVAVPQRLQDTVVALAPSTLNNAQDFEDEFELVSVDSEPTVTGSIPTKSIQKAHAQFERKIIAHPHVMASGVPKPQNHRELAKPEPTDEPEDLEMELSNDRASVAPSEGNHCPGRTRRPRGSGRTQAPTYDSLPTAASRTTFKDVFMPTIAKYLSKLPNAWSTSTPEYVHVIQSVWNEVFPKIPYTFSVYGARCDIARLITQRTYEWRGRFASAAIDAVLDLEDSDADFQDPSFRKNWVAWAKEDGIWPFLYADTDSEDPDDWSGTFASELITKAFASHLAYTANSVIIHQLSDLEAQHPSGALALATAAVERALIVWDKGDLQDWHRLRDEERPSLPKFDATTWSVKTESWMMSIDTLDGESWDDITDIALAYVKPISRKKPSSGPAETNDNRAMLVARPRRK